MTEHDVQRWLDAYVEAWANYEPAAIAALFAPAASYAYHPYEEPLLGRDAIVASWLEHRDDKERWEATYRPFIVQGDLAIATGETRYAGGDVYANLFELRFDADGRCAALVEWYVAHPQPEDSVIS